jgi:hypothetical protein
VGNLNRFMLNRLVSNQKVSHLVETGYGAGASCQAALDAGFAQAWSCEIFGPLHAAAPQGERLHVVPTDSLAFLQAPDTVAVLQSHRSLVFLDAHYPGADHGGQGYRNTARPSWERLPLLAELELLRDKVDNALVIVDDVRIYRRNFKVAEGANPDWAENAWAEESRFVELLESFAATHSLHWHSEDTGYAVLWPLSWGPCDLQKWVLPGDRTIADELQLGVPGTTCMSLHRRLHDARFATRWLVGQGLDIGGGQDSIGLYGGLFPRMQSVTVYDRPQGDAQYLSNVRDGSFDFVYSSHCLEHMVDPQVALNNWMRVLKVGGYGLVAVPDEDLYEQGVWPSTFNDDHKHTFTIFKRRSWSPVSINVLELLRGLDGETCIEKIERLDHAFLPGYVRFDQTRTSFSECGIEVVIKKL